jgi:hypothetical protein
MTEAITRVTSVLSIGGSRTEEPDLHEVDQIWGEVLEPTDITESVSRDSDVPVSAGAVGDIFKGIYYPNTRKNSMKRFWRSLSHPSLDKPIPVAIKVLRASLADGAFQDEAKTVSLEHLTQ